MQQQFMASLLAQPESGMGYQLVEVEQRDGVRKRGVAYNAELVLLSDEPRVQVRAANLETLLKSAQSSEATIKAIRVVRAERSAAMVLEKASESKKPGEAKDAPVGSTAAAEVFTRFSAFEKDRRVQSDGSLSAGTYATTEADGRNVKTGSEAVRRYALPNSAPASFVFTSKPHTGTPIQRGVVATANGQPGGGVEVIFTAGTQAGTTTGPVKIPD